MTNAEQAIKAVLSLHCKAAEAEAGKLGPYCVECTSELDGGPEIYPCMTVKTILDALGESARHQPSTNTVLRDLPESFWDVAVWDATGEDLISANANIDRGDRHRIVEAILGMTQEGTK